VTLGTETDCTIRGMRESDIEIVHKLAGELKDAPHWPASVYLAALDSNRLPRRIALVAERLPEGEIIGFAIANLIAPHAELESIAVRTDWQRKRIGRSLLAELASEARAAAMGEFLLEVRASNLTAREFYSSLGWRETGKRSRYYVDPEEDAILLSLVLG
jgi:tRNA threonylcarbamoyladenosine biosynthesis protein TsaB